MAEESKVWIHACGMYMKANLRQDVSWQDLAGIHDPVWVKQGLDLLHPLDTCRVLRIL